MNKSRRKEMGRSGRKIARRVVPQVETFQLNLIGDKNLSLGIVSGSRQSKVGVSARAADSPGCRTPTNRDPHCPIVRHVGRSIWACVARHELHVSSVDGWDTSPTVAHRLALPVTTMKT